MMHEPKSPDAGYSLLELLVAFSLILLLAAFLFDGLKFGNRVWETSQETRRQQADILSVLQLLENLLGNAYPVFVENETGVLEFTGNRSKIEFIAPLQQGLLYNEFSHIRLFHDGGQQTLNLTWSAGTSSITAARILLEDVKAVQFAYFGNTKDGEQGEWHDDWKRHEDLPELVKITIQFSGANNPVMPDIVIKPRIDWSADCVFDAAASICRRRVS